MTGRVSANAEENAKLICEKMVSFDAVPRRLWVRFADEKEYDKAKEKLFGMIADSDGNDSVVIYTVAENKRTVLPQSHNIKITAELVASLRSVFGEKNVETT